VTSVPPWPSAADKTRSHVVAEERKLRDVGSLLDRQDAAGVAAVLGVPQRGTPKGGFGVSTGQLVHADEPSRPIDESCIGEVSRSIEDCALLT
jgi:hypothetical protein